MADHYSNVAIPTEWEVSLGYLIRIPHHHHGGSPPPPPAQHHNHATEPIGARLRSRLIKLCDDAGIPHTSPHGLRHTSITLARDAGIPDESAEYLLHAFASRVCAIRTLPATSCSLNLDADTSRDVFATRSNKVAGKPAN